MSTPNNPLARLPNLGPASQRMLAAAHIHTPTELKTLGAAEAYSQVRHAHRHLPHQPATLNLLWALEGAITAQPWQTVARQHRTSLLLALDTLQHTKGSA
ncbi:MAG: TfoX/Sxy family protein [Burkholderiales bacterium]|nr:TfoX/Sxy family protein [Burkholderiales bacterium]